MKTMCAALAIVDGQLHATSAAWSCFNHYPIHHQIATPQTTFQGCDAYTLDLGARDTSTV